MNTPPETVVSDWTDNPVAMALSDCGRDEEPQNVLRFLRREQTDAIRCGGDERYGYVADLIRRLEQGEHR